MTMPTTSVKGRATATCLFSTHPQNAKRNHHHQFPKPKRVYASSSDPRNNDDESGSTPTAEELVQQLLNKNQAQVERVTDAARRVAELQLEQARLARALADAEVNDPASAQRRERRAEAAASKLVADAEAKAAALLLRAAELEADAADAVRESVAAQADLEAERVESIKAGGAAAVGGALGSLPLLLANAGTLLDLGGALTSSLLFGLVYRYAVRKDVENLQLRGGVVAAFGLVRGMALAVPLLEGAVVGDDVIEIVGAAGLGMGASMLLFGFASVGVEAAFARGWVKRFE